MRRIGTRTRIAAVACVVFVTALAATSHAFWSTAPDVHGAITGESLQRIFTPEAGKKTLEKIIKNNTDQDGLFSAEKNLEKAHIDSETFGDAIALMETRLNAAVTALSTADKETALKNIGQVLHALQDFYSHSTWVENHLLPGDMSPHHVPIYAGLVTKDGAGSFNAGPLTENRKFVKPTLVCTFDPAKPYLPKPFEDDLTKLAAAGVLQDSSGRRAPGRGVRGHPEPQLPELPILVDVLRAVVPGVDGAAGSASGL